MRTYRHAQEFQKYSSTIFSQSDDRRARKIQNYCTPIFSQSDDRCVNNALVICTPLRANSRDVSVSQRHILCIILKKHQVAYTPKNDAKIFEILGGPQKKHCEGVSLAAELGKWRRD